MPISLKAISIAFPGGGLIFEGSTHLSLGRNGKFCSGFRGTAIPAQPKLDRKVEISS